MVIFYEYFYTKNIRLMKYGDHEKYKDQFLLSIDKNPPAIGSMSSWIKSKVMEDLLRAAHWLQVFKLSDKLFMLSAEFDLLIPLAYSLNELLADGFVKNSSLLFWFLSSVS